jgi:hypothetical protein
MLQNFLKSPARDILITVLSGMALLGFVFFPWYGIGTYIDFQNIPIVGSLISMIVQGVNIGTWISPLDVVMGQQGILGQIRNRTREFGYPVLPEDNLITWLLLASILLTLIFSIIKLKMNIKRQGDILMIASGLSGIIIYLGSFFYQGRRIQNSLLGLFHPIKFVQWGFWLIFILLTAVIILSALPRPAAKRKRNRRTNYSYGSGDFF